MNYFWHFVFRRFNPNVAHQNVIFNLEKFRLTGVTATLCCFLQKSSSTPSTAASNFVNETKSFPEGSFGSLSTRTIPPRRRSVSRTRPWTNWRSSSTEAVYPDLEKRWTIRLGLVRLGKVRYALLCYGMVRLG